MTLPDPTEAAEDRFVARWRDHGESLTTLIEAVENALAQGRPGLASRLAQLLDASADTHDHPEVTRALQAGQLRLLTDDEPSSETTADDYQQSRRERMRTRQRNKLREPRGVAGPGTRPPRTGRGRRRE